MVLEPLHPIQIQRFHQMSFAEKWAVGQGLWLMARDARLRAAREANPNLSEAEYQKSSPVSSAAPEPNLIALFARSLHEVGIRYLIAGSIGSPATRAVSFTKNRKNQRSV